MNINYLYNLALLVLLVVVIDLLMRHGGYRIPKYRVMLGLLIGGAAILGMLNPVTLAPGVFFDGRSVLISVGAFIGGPVTAVIAAALALAYRIYLGGAGWAVGSSVIVWAAVVGLAFYYLRPRFPRVTHPLLLLVFGLIVHLGMLALMLALPGGISGTIVRSIALPVLTIFPLALVIICLLFLDQEKYYAALGKLSAEEQALKKALEAKGKAENEAARLASFPRLNPHPVTEFSMEGNVIFANQAARQLFPDLESLGADHPFLEDWPHIVSQLSSGSASHLTREVKVADRFYMQTIQYIESPRSFRIYARDITARKASEEKGVRLNQVLRALRNVNQLITRVDERQALLEGACRNLIETRGFERCWISATDYSGQTIATAESQWGTAFEPVAQQMAQGQQPPCVAGVLERGKAILLTAEGHAATCGDCRLSCYLRRGSIVAPMNYAGRVMGVLAAVTPESINVDSEELDLFQEMADDIGFALHNIERDKERRQMENEMAISETRYRRLFEAAKDGILILDADTGEVVDVNPFLIKLLGFSRDGFLGRKIWELGFLNDVIASKANFDKLQCAGYVRYEDLPLATASGKRIDVEFVSNVYEVDHRKVIQCNIRDITQRKAAERDAQRVARHEATLLAAVPDIIMETNNDRVYTWANEAGIEFFGKDAIGKEAAEYFEGEQETYPKVQPLFNGTADTIYVESWQKRKDGEKRLLAWWCRPLRDTDGHVTGSLSVAQDITERKQFEQKLADEIERRSQMFNLTPVGIVIIDPQSLRFLEFNQIAHQQLGYTREEFAALTMPDVAALESAPETRERLASIMQGGKVEFETRQRTREGEIRDVQITAQLIRAAGRPVYQTIWQDITERKIFERALALSEAQYRLLMDNVPSGVSIMHQGKIVFANRSVETITGYSPAELQAMDVFGIIHPDDREVVRAYNTNRLKGENAPSYYDLRIIHKDGSVHWLSQRLVPVKWLDNPAVLVLDSDITQRKQAETALKAAAEEWRATFDSIQDMVAIVDVNHVIARINQAFARALKRDIPDLLGKHCYEVVHGLDRPHAMCPHARTMGSGKFESSEYYDENLHLWVEAASSPIIDEQGRITGTVHVIKDISARKLAEEEQQQLRNKTEISSRLAAVGEMAAGIAHEINNPLTSVLGFSQLLSDRQDLPDDVKEELKIIADGSLRVKSIVKRMLTFARQTKQYKTMVDIHELIDNTLEIRSYVLKTANIEVEKRYDPDLPRVLVDPGQMQQVFLNLVVNAEYSMKEAHGRGKLVITSSRIDSHIRISFRDDGSGINAEIKAKLFHPFFTTKQVGEGTGLGLSLSRSIVLEHRGTIEVDSQAGQGADFIITLPVPQQDETAESRARVEEGAKIQYTPSAGILVVDDEEAIRKLISAILSPAGHVVETTGNAPEALARLERRVYDVIILDIRMPGMSGMDLQAEIIRRHPAMKGRFIFVTGDASDPTTREFLEKNGHAYITKPFDREMLLAKIGNVLSACGGSPTL